ncbi:iron complex transport system permease protein [Yoonia tamlensis]|uniref:Iron complex transport system permease protein n=1 Tax=Yoonia tamlensis TaxID=390270 RepID=A0A1I6FP26_9RHOB|nr:iron ABC transporter permease [Yoonia tamlensis]SFR31547.1 iron complex transport system permease protein [Yoonia tamlensis]
MILRLSAPLIFLGFLAILATGIGSSWMPLDRVVAALFGQGTRTDEIIIWTLRMPRVLLAMLAGAALALAGLLLQHVVRNPIASPSVLGLVDGAAVGVVLFLMLFSNEANALVVSVHWLPLAATLGALSFAALVALVAARDLMQPARLILYGIAAAALAKALVTVLIVLGPVYRAGQSLIWLAGSVHAAHWDDVAILTCVLVVLTPVLAAMARPLDQLLLDDQSAGATGLALNYTKVAVLGLSVILTAAAVSFAGGLAFVGLLAPHIARALVGLRMGALLIVTPAVGAAIVLGADIFARTMAAPLELPTGAITALVGAPYFFWLLIKEVRRD